MTEIFVGIGSNIQPLRHVPLALEHLTDAFGPLRVSDVYQCPAVGFDGNDFVNLVVGFDRTDDVYTLQTRLREIETACGRDRSIKQASRTLDLDLLLYGDAVIDTDGLTLPRADILEYAFVLKPLAQLAPNCRHPVEGATYAELWAGFDATSQPLTRIHLDGGPRL